MSHTLDAVCQSAYIAYENSLSTVYHAIFPVNQIKKEWYVEKFTAPSEDPGKAYDKEFEAQKRISHLTDMSLRSTVYSCVYLDAVRTVKGTEYYYVTAPRKPLSSSKYISSNETTYLKLLQLGSDLCSNTITLENAGFHNLVYSFDNLAVDQSIDGCVQMSHLYIGGEEKKSSIYNLADFLWFIASGCESKYEESPAADFIGLPEDFKRILIDVLLGEKNDIQDLRKDLELEVMKIKEGARQNAVIKLNNITQPHKKKSSEVIAQATSSDFALGRYNVKEYIDQKKQLDQIDIATDENDDMKMESFQRLCSHVKQLLDKLDAEEINEETSLQRQRKALMGYQKESDYYKAKINDIVVSEGLSKRWKPSWYSTVTEAIYGELLGFSGISNWISGEEYKNSVSCKIIGDRVYYKENGYLKLQPQRISKERRALLKRTLLLATPKESLAKPWHEVYTVADHLRVTIYNDNGVTKPGEDVIIFRRYILKNLTLEEQVIRGTFPKEALPLFKNMVKLGYNVCFTGPVESAKSTMMQAYQSLEDPLQEASSIESDDETQYQKLMPTAPIIQFCPSPEQETTVLDRLKRSDSNYVIVGEARNGLYLQMAVDSANMGTRRMKMTFHNTETVDFAYDVAEKIIRDSGTGDIVSYMIKVAKSFNYIINMTSLPGNRGKKRLKGIWEMRFDAGDMQIYMHQVCKYVPEKLGQPEHWLWDDFIGEPIREAGEFENYAVFKEFENSLRRLKELSPNLGTTDFKNPYMDVYLKRV